MNTYEFRKWNIYEEWFVIDAKDEKEAREKLNEMGEEDIQTRKFVGQDGETELYRVKYSVADEEEREPDEEIPEEASVEREVVGER